VTVWTVAALPGDGIGPEVLGSGLRVMGAIADRFGRDIEVVEASIGYTAWSETGVPFPPRTIEAVERADATLLGAIGDPRADALPAADRPEAALLELRRKLSTFANLRPARIGRALRAVSPLRPERAESVDFVIVRELTGGIYYGQPRSQGQDTAVNTMVYTAPEIERVAHTAFRLAGERRGRVTSVDKANVLEVSRLWRETVTRVSAEYPQVELEHMLVDRTAMEIILSPERFDVLLMANLFGDVLSDEAGAICGSLGLLPSASLGAEGGIFEPVHGSAPELVGRGVANPVGMILSVALMLRHAFGAAEEARVIEEAVERCLADGLRTPDVATPGSEVVGTDAFADRVVREVTR
jgi:3-isopropylmalate dehydrogenase